MRWIQNTLATIPVFWHAGGGEELRRRRDAGRKGEREAAPVEVVEGRSDDEHDAREREGDDGEECAA